MNINMRCESEIPYNSYTEMVAKVQFRQSKPVIVLRVTSCYVKVIHD